MLNFFYPSQLHTMFPLGFLCWRRWILKQSQDKSFWKISISPNRNWWAYLFKLQHNAHTGAGLAPALSILTFSSPLLFLIVTIPLAKPRASRVPSSFQLQQQIRAPMRNFCTFFCSGLHKPKSLFEQLARIGLSGLYARHWIESLWLK